MLIPAALDWYDGRYAEMLGFFYSAILTTCISTLVLYQYRNINNQSQNYDIRSIFFQTTLLWIVVILFGSIPLKLSMDIGYIDAIFETTSSVTTTGYSTIRDIEALSRGMLLWRTILTFIGGIGIIVLSTIILPNLKVGGMQIFKTESSDTGEKMFPKMISTSKAMLIVYLSIISITTISLLVCKLDFLTPYAIPYPQHFFLDILIIMIL